MTPADLEALQALLLTASPQEGAHMASGDFGEIWSRIRSQYFALVMDPPLTFLGPEKERLANGVRLHSAYYRNPYGITFFRRMMLSIAGEYDKRYRRGNASVSSFFRFILAVFEKIEERLSEFREKLMIRVEGSEDEVHRLMRDLSARNAYARAILSTVDVSTLPAETLRLLCHDMLDASGSDLFAFTREELRALSPEASYDPILAVDQCSMSFGDLAPANFEKITGGNPIWGRPFIRAHDKYYLFAFFTALSFPFQLFLSIASGDPAKEKERLEDLRAKFLEKEGESLFKEHLPTVQTFRNLFWFDASGKRYETDILGVAPGRLVILEAKGGILPDRVRSGNFIKAKDFFKQGYAFAGLQATRLRDEIRRSTDGLRLFTEDGQEAIKLANNYAENVIAYSLTLEQLGTLANARRLFEEVGVIDPSTLPVPPLMVSELSRILELLPNETYCLHYLERRHQLYSAVEVVGDELDIFATYIMQGFSSLPLRDVHLITLLNASFYLSHHVKDGELAIPPSSSLSNTRYFDRVFRYLLERRPANFFELAFAILDTPAELQSSFEEMMRDLRSRASERTDEIQVGSMGVNGALTSHVLAGSVYGEIDRENRNGTLIEGLADAMSKRGIRSGLLIGRQLGYFEYPYSVIFYLKMKKEPDSRS